MLFGINKSGGPVSGVASMLASMLGVTPEELVSSINGIQSILLETAAAMSHIEGGNRAILNNQREIMIALNCQGKYDDGPSDRASGQPGITDRTGSAADPG